MSRLGRTTLLPALRLAPSLVILNQTGGLLCGTPITPAALGALSPRRSGSTRGQPAAAAAGQLSHELFCSDLRSLVCYALTMTIIMAAAYAFIVPAGPSIIVLAATVVLVFHRR